ncbi:IclR family transcriptional regulator [Paraburkholderia caribensis]|uniref:IclR family transcriptional regulator n=1 Tax=Paraburkholderia caribensis TaxID=75105 RepID=UPI00341F1D65
MQAVVAGEQLAPTRMPSSHIRPMSSLRRMLSLLDAFSPATPVLTAEEIMAKLGYSRGTAYRYVRELCSVGLLTSIGGAYALGPRIIELDYFIRESDPVLHASRTTLQALRERFECDVLLTSFYEDRVVVTHHEQSTDHVEVSYGRGRVMPLFYGAGSKVILATLPNPRQKRIFNVHQPDIADAGMGNDWPEFRSTLSAIRRAGYAISMSELDPGNVGVSAPISHAESNTYGSIVLVLSSKHYEILDKSLLTKAVVAGAQQIIENIAHDSKALPPDSTS